LSYDLGDAVKWEFFFPNIEKPLLVVPPGEEPTVVDDDDDDDEEMVTYNIMSNVHASAYIYF